MGCLRIFAHRGNHLTDLVRVVVNGLLTADDQIRIDLFDISADELGNVQRLCFKGLVRLNENALIGTHSKGRAQCFLRLCIADGHCDHFVGNALFFHLNSLFECNFVERVHRVFEVSDVEFAVRSDFDLNIGVDHPFDRDKNFHLFL